MALSKEERLRVLADIKEKGFKIWPTPAEGQAYGPTPKQLEAFLVPHGHPQDVLLYYGGARSGKCLGKDTEVLMFNGQVKKVQDIEVDDLLMGPDSKPRRVLSLARGRETMYKVIPSRNAEPLVCNESHILSLSLSSKSAVMAARYKGEEPRTTKRYKQDVVNISIKDYLTWAKHKKKAYKLYTAGGLDFPTISNDLPIDPYMLGLWLGDGNSNGFAITTMDEEIHSSMRQYAEATGTGFKHYSDSGKASTWALSGCKPGDIPLASKLKLLDVYKNKHIPDLYKLGSKETRLQLLAGLIDTDGHLSNGSYYEIIQKNKRLGYDIAFVARSLGFYCSVSPVRKSCIYKGQRKEGLYYRVNISPSQDIPVRVERKKLTYKKSHFDYRHFGFKLENLGEGDYYGFTLDGDSLFIIAPSFFVTHNTKSAVAAGIAMSLETPGIAGMVGCEEFTHLEKSAMEDYKRLLSIHSDWDHPLVYRKPTSHKKRVQFINGSIIWFMHFSDFSVLRGIELAFGHIEEASLLKDKAVFGEVQRRLSSNRVKCRRLLITSNPEESKGWLYETFNLQQFEPGYKGDPQPIGKPCRCQFCFRCSTENEVDDSGAIVLVDKKPVPRSIAWVDGLCPLCKTVKNGSCPGDQKFWRVIMADPKDNAHIPEDWRETQRQSTTEQEFELYTEGKVIELRSNKCYPNYKFDKNVVTSPMSLDYKKPLFWNFDFNIAYQCSCIVQEQNEDGQVYANILDEIVLPNAGPDDVAKEFLRRYWAFDEVVYFIFDPSAFNNSIRPDDGMVRIKIIVDILEHPDQHGHPGVQPKKCVLITRKEERKTKVMVSARVDSVNHALDDRHGFNRIRVNPHLKWLLRSLEDLKWTDNSGKPVIDTAPDKLAAKAIDKKTLRTLSHPTDALGYYIYKRFPLLAPKYSQMYGFIPGEALVVTTKDGKNVNTIEDKFKPITDEDRVKLVFDLDEVKDPTQQSLREMLDTWGAFDNSTNPFGGFWE